MYMCGWVHAWELACVCGVGVGGGAGCVWQHECEGVCFPLGVVVCLHLRSSLFPNRVTEEKDNPLTL